MKKNRDLQAALMVIGRRNIEHDPENSLVDLRRSNLSFTTLDNGNYVFKTTIFTQSNLTSIQWCEVNLEAAFFNYSDLTDARFDKCNLTNANLNVTTVKNANFNESNLQKAKFQCTKTFGFVGFIKANLKGTNFSFCDNLTQKEIEGAIGDETTILPESLEMPESWKNRK